MKKKNFLLTGGSRGLGLEISKAILQTFPNSRVFCISRTFSDELQFLKKKYPSRLLFKSVDLSNPNLLKERIFSEFLPLNIPIHGFVNNAAFAYDDIITNIKISSLEKLYKVNVFSPLLLTKYVIRNMIFNKIQGSIIHISSISVHTGYKGLAVYASTKGALEAFSKNTAREWGSRKIRSNSIVAGFMETEMSKDLTKVQKNRIYKRTSLKSATSISSVSKTVSFLLSDSSESITGQNIFVDNGTI